jgi:RNA polymerase sigma-70 factor (ECF subfamily)
MEKVETPEPSLVGVYPIIEKPDRARTDELVSRACRGDFEAFEKLYHRHVGRIHGLCLRMSADPRTAEELTQDAFSRAWEKLGTFRGGAGFAAWLKRLAVNVVLTDRRTRGRRAAHEQPADEPARRHAADTTEPATALDLEEAIRRLPPRAREVFVLHDVEGYRHDEIAGFLGIAPGTSKTQLHRARRLLRETLRASPREESRS